MPIFAYYCDKCHKSGEWLERHDEEGRDCPYCDEAMRRIPGIPARVRPGKYGKAGGLAENNAPNLRTGGGE